MQHGSTPHNVWWNCGCILLYSSTVFPNRLQTHAKRVTKVDWKIAICCGRLYKTVSYLPSTVISGRLPLALVTVTFARRKAASKDFLLYGDLKISQPLSTSPTIAVVTLSYDDAMATRWKWYTKCLRRSWTNELIPSTILHCAYDNDFFLSQALSGHGCFQAYLYKMKRSDSDKCRYGAIESLSHIFWECTLYVAARPLVLDLCDGGKTVDYLWHVVADIWRLEHGGKKYQ